MTAPTRRAVIGGGAATVALAAAPAGARRGGGRDVPLLPAQHRWGAEPPPPPGLRDGVAPLGDGRLRFWDTGGAGAPVVLLHAFTGSADSWGYQRTALAAAGYRVIGYSRRGHAGSDPVAAGAPDYAIDDLHALAAYLDLPRFHLVGTAGGGFYVADYALAHPERLLSIAIASSQGGIEEPAFADAVKAITPPAFMALAPELKELSASYRAANPAGTARWIALEKAAHAGTAPRPGKRNRIDWAALRRIAVPALLMTGDADLYFPPSLLRMVLANVPRMRGAIMAEAGHAAHWEQPDAFNAALTRFWRTRASR